MPAWYGILSLLVGIPGATLALVTLIEKKRKRES
jgi:hypothetical protein